MGGAIQLQLTTEQGFDTAASQRPALIVLELYAHALHTISVTARRRHPDYTACDRQFVRIIHQADEHEDLIAELVAARGRNEDAAALHERHIRRVKNRLLFDVQ